MPKFGTKKASCRYFWPRILKNFRHNWNQQPQICLTATFCEKSKSFWIWNQKSLIWVFWTGIWKKILSYMKLASLNLSCSKVWCKIKILKFETKNVWFGYFWAGIWKWYCYIWNQHTRICLIAKLREEIKISKFGTKNV